MRVYINVFQPFQMEPDEIRFFLFHTKQNAASDKISPWTPKKDLNKYPIWRREYVHDRQMR